MIYYIVAFALWFAVGTLVQGRFGTLYAVAFGFQYCKVWVIYLVMVIAVLFWPLGPLMVYPIGYIGDKLFNRK